MEEAIANLLTNAATHTLGGTRIWVSAEANQGLRRLFISVSDEGPGVPEALREKIFDKFSRGLSPQGAGLGLGLSIVRGFMLAQGGDVAVDSAPAGGARFTLSIPHVGFAPAPTA
jgi:two-component system sensor histidine kinase KdpD